MNVRTPFSQFDDQVRLGKVRVDGLFPDALTGRLSLEQNLAADHLIPASLPPGGLLVVKQLRIQIRHASLMSRNHPGNGESVQQAMEDLVRQAARPVMGPAPAGAAAVLFADPTELLACLGSDAVESQLGERWWWTRINPPARTLTDVLAHWAAYPEWIPGAAALLRKMGKLAAFGRLLPEQVAQNLLKLVLDCFGLLDLPSRPTGGIFAHDERSKIDKEKGTQSSIQAVRRTDTGSDDLAFRLQFGLEGGLPGGLLEELSGMIGSAEIASAHLPADSAMLLGVSLGLAQAPENLRIAIRLLNQSGHSWQEIFARLLVESAKELSAGLNPSQVIKGTLSNTAAPMSAADQDELVAERAGSLVTANTGLLVNREQEGPFAQTQLIESEKWEVLHTLPGVKPTGGELEYIEPGMATKSHRANQSLDDSATVSPAYQPPRANLQALNSPGGEKDAIAVVATGKSEIVTAFGGLFYLINLALYLGLYQDFGRFVGADIPLSPWDFLALVGYAWFGSNLEADPLWGLLSKLAGRTVGQLPGEGFSIEEDWRLPAFWLKPFVGLSKTWEWWVEGNPSGMRLNVAYPAGFKVLDLNLKNRDPQRLAQKEIRLYRLANREERIYLRHRKDRRMAQDIDEETPGLRRTERWLGWLLPYLAARLCVAFGLGVAEPGLREHAARLLCLHPARVLSSAARIDIFLSLAELPVMIRYAGLDRDPWWVPAAGHFIVFHFD